MTQNDDNSVDESSTVSSGPGRQLREARESRQLTREQVASQLRMQVRIIDALESDDYSDLPGTTFVQGYLRSYSRLLELPEEAMVAQLSAGGGEPELVGSILGGKAEVSSRDFPVRLINVLIIVAVVIGVGWWLSQYEPAIEEELPELVSPGSEQQLQLPEESQAVQGGVEVEVESSTSDEITLEAEVGSVGEVVDEESTTVEEPPSVVEQPQTVEIIQDTQAATPAELTASMPQSRLELEYQADSWSEISDAAGRELTYGLIPAGENLKLNGEAPFKVFLGYASGVTVYYNGILYDHTPYQRGDVARFRIGRTEHNQPLAGN